MKKKKKCPPEGAPEWMTTYGDMVTLLLCFFVMLFTTATVDGHEMRLVIAAFSGMGLLEGGNTLQAGQLAELGNTLETLPSMDKGRALDEARRRAISIFQPEVDSKKVRITQDERGLIISLAADSFFRPASAEVDIEASRQTLQKVSNLLTSLGDSRRFRIEGHSDSSPTDPEGPWATNWELSTQRATNVLHYLVDFGVSEQLFQVGGYSDTRPVASNDTPDGRAYNRRVDIVVMTEGHF